MSNENPTALLRPLAVDPRHHLDLPADVADPIVALLLHLDHVATTGSRASLRRCYVEAGAVLVEEVRRLRAEVARLHADNADLLATADADQHMHTRAVRAEAALEDARNGADLAADRANRLQAEVTELRLTLAAEQGRQEGAPSARWAWRGDHWLAGPDIDAEARAWPGGRLYLRDPKRICGTLTKHGTARAAMQAADAATAPCASPAPASPASSPTAT